MTHAHDSDIAATRRSPATGGGDVDELRAVVGPTPRSGHGECFIWKSGTDVVAVDAGGAGPVGRHAGQHRPHILILSHDDNDHIRGAVSLIVAAGDQLRELWVPAEWAILVKQLADSSPDAMLPQDDGLVNIRDVETELGSWLSELRQEEEFTAGQLRATISSAELTLAAWTTAGSSAGDGFRLVDESGSFRQWYGAKDLAEILDRVRKRAKPLLAIFSATLAQGLRIKFFSIDRALARGGTPWMTAGQPGVATFANALEAPHALAVRMPPGLPRTYALTRITVQNRRALCSLLWRAPHTPDNGVLIWSDTDGNWLDHLAPSAVTQLAKSLSATSAPHHASGNSAHDRVWQTLARARADLVMISAGGQKNQSYRADYDVLAARRCCTWCRPNHPAYQEVVAISAGKRAMQLKTTCLVQH